MWVNFIGPLNMMARNQLLYRLVQQRAPDVVPSDLVRGLMGLKSLESNRELQNLAAQAQVLGDEIQRLLIEEDDETIRAVLSTSEKGQALVDELDTFLDHYGFLSASGTDLSRTPWAENPTLIWHAIGRAAAHPRRPTAQNVEEIREEARERVRTRLNRVQRFFFARLLASTITYIDLRERSSFLISEDSFEMRRIFLALADQLVTRGDLHQRDDIFYLALDELRELVNGELEAMIAQERVAARRADMEYDAQIELPHTICGDYVPAHPILPAEDREYLAGISGSSGLAEGCARIVHDPADAPVTLTPNDILVVPFSDMSWTPLFSGIGGVVAETGGQLSHSAIVAREYGLPAVVNVKNATRLIQDGQPIAVDGNHGRVYLRQR
jgi:phosphohistidine swiveling domain-containing protein